MDGNEGAPKRDMWNGASGERRPVDFHIQVTPEMYKYIDSVALREPEALEALRIETTPHPRSGMLITPGEGQFLGLLVELIGAKKILDIGTFTGYSSTAMALHLPPDGKLITLDISEEFTAVAKRYWKKAGVEDRVELRLAPAMDTMQEMLANGEAGTFDMIFLDAGNKNEYPAYVDTSLELLRQGGLLLIDNTLFAGLLVPSIDADTLPEARKHQVKDMRAFNEWLHYDERVTISMVPISDGLTLARKR